MWSSNSDRKCLIIARTAIAEEAALAVPGITNSEGAEAGYGRTEVTLVTSAGFAGRYGRTSHSLSATALAGSGTGMQRDYDYTSTVHYADLEDAAKGFAAHSDQERILEAELYRFVRFSYEIVYDLVRKH